MMRRDRQSVPARAGSATAQVRGASPPAKGVSAPSRSDQQPTPAAIKGTGRSASKSATTPAPAQPKVLFSTTCWSCGQAVHKPVTKRNLRQRHFSWICTDCDVSWWGPGQEA